MSKKHETPETELDTPDIDFQQAGEEASEDVLKLEAELNEAIEKRDEYLNMAQRVQADFDNFRRRNNAARADAYDEGAYAFIKTLLPVIDNMERAVLSAKDTTDIPLRDGVAMILNQLMEALEKRGVTPIDRQGEPFDPNLENAVLQGTEEEGEPGTVCEVFQKGYQTEKMVLRHAMVKVVAE